MSMPIIVALIGLLIGISTIGILSGCARGARDRQRSSAMMLGLGVGIDYALFILARHRQNLDCGHAGPESRRSRQRNRRPVGPVRRRHRDRGHRRSAGLRHPDDDDDGLGLGDDGRGRRWSPRSPCCRPCWAGRRARSTALRVPFVKQKSGLRPELASPRVGRLRWSPSRSASAWSPTVILGVLAAAGLRDAARLRRRRQRRPDLHDPQGLRPGRRHYGPGVNGPFSVVVESDGAPRTTQAAADVSRRP